ncbi:MAG TPA: N-6 DNA methylase [Thermoanaerobaculia bacterium]|jgi:type I restriction enzyme M protein|nr:N-6 DNA methylase [Thermoanaerobaculia bacterium]
MKTAQWIRDRRTAAGLSQAELAQKVGVTQPIVSQWERGIAKPSPLVLDELRAALERPAEPTPPPVVEAVRDRPAASAEPEPAPRRGRAKKTARAASGANLGFEDKLWAAADKLRGHMDASEYKHVVLGLIFLKYISDAFEEQRATLERDPHSNPEDRDEYLATRVFWVPEEARWSGPNGIQVRAKEPAIGHLIDKAMEAIEKENPTLKGVLPKDYGRPTLDKIRLGELVDLISTIGLGDADSRSKDILGRVYEYFLGKFAAAEGKSGGEFYTPQCIVKLLVEMLEPFRGRVYDPCCGSGGMFVSSERFVLEHGGRRDDIAIYGQESNPTTWKLARMNLAIRGIEANLGPENADSFHRDLHPDLKADFILANPHFNDSDWGGERLREDKRWAYGTPPAGNANYAWIQHFISHLKPTGVAGFVLANGSMSSNQSGEGEIRKKIVEADLVDCMIALPPQLFYTTGIPVCLWFLARDKKNHKFRDRRGEALFIDARKMGRMTDRTHRELTDNDIAEIACVYHAWRGEKGQGKYKDKPGFCRAAEAKEIKDHGYVLTPGRYVGAAEEEDDDEPFDQKMRRLSTTLEEQFVESSRLERVIRENLTRLWNEE